MEFTETLALTGSLLVWTIFGAVFVAFLLNSSLSWAAVGYAILSLTIIRMLPVAVALVGQGFRAETLAFIGWLGRGGWPRWSSPCWPSRPCTRWPVGRNAPPGGD